MTREEKVQAIADLKQQLGEHEFFYLADSSTLSVEEINQFRALCHESDVVMQVVKNTLVQKAMEESPEERGFEALFEYLKGPTSILFTKTANAPARILRKFREKFEKPVLKAAYIDTDIFAGDEKVRELADLKSKEELIGEVIALLQSPMRNIVSALESGKQTLAGLIKALEEREESN
jgi:large subunit ribosomal protein L10